MRRRRASDAGRYAQARRRAIDGWRVLLIAAALIAAPVVAAGQDSQASQGDRFLGTERERLQIPGMAVVVAESASQSASQHADRAELTELNRQWFEACRTQDLTALDRVLANDFAAVYPGDRLMTKSDLMTLASRPGRTVDAVAWTDLRILLFGDIAVVTGRVSMSGETADGPFSATSSYADVYSRRDDRWVAVSAHVVRGPSE